MLLGFYALASIDLITVIFIVLLSLLSHYFMDLFFDCLLMREPFCVTYVLSIEKGVTKI